MKVGKITLRDKQAWLALYTNEGQYIGTMHLVDNSFLKVIKESIERIKE